MLNTTTNYCMAMSNRLGIIFLPSCMLMCLFAHMTLFAAMHSLREPAQCMCPTCVHLFVWAIVFVHACTGKPPPPALANATTKDDVLTQPRQYHSWQCPLTMASGADGHCQTCVHIFTRTSLSLSNCLRSMFVASRSTGDLEVWVCALTHMHSLETASFTASGADSTAKRAYICSYEQAVLFCARCSHPSRRADKLEVGRAHCVREHT